MSVHDIHMMIRHESWANQRVALSLSELADIPEKALKIFNHIFAAQHTWISRINNTAPEIGIWPELEVADWVTWSDRNMHSLLEIASSEEALSRVIEYSNSKGDKFSNPVSELIIHLMLHSQYHRGQVIAYSIDKLDHVPVTDMIAYLRTS